jgi:hypothetical protein
MPETLQLVCLFRKDGRVVGIDKENRFLHSSGSSRATHLITRVLGFLEAFVPDYWVWQHSAVCSWPILHSAEMMRVPDLPWIVPVLEEKC